MHRDFEISINQVSKIEGHSDLYIKVRKGEVEDVKLKIVENKRFYTQAVRGKPYNNVHQTVSRICGTCSVAHLTACAEAVENAIGLKITPQTRLLRELGMFGLMVRDHALHLYLFAMPDLYKKDSILEFDGPIEKFAHHAFAVKAAGNKLCTLIEGRAVHPTLAQIGSFLKMPAKQEAKDVVKGLQDVRPQVLELIDVFKKCEFKFERSCNFVGLSTPNFNYTEGEIVSSSGVCIPERHFWDHLNRVVVPYSQATAFEFEGEPYMVGALARINLSQRSLHKQTKKDAASALSLFPSNNVFHNNLAQAIEMLHCIDFASEILETKEFKPEPAPKLVPQKANGVGVIEAPRGTLYYMLSLEANGKVRYGNLVIPTAQNQIMMERDIKNILPSLLDKPENEIRFELEKLIRAYDPCMSCASHFLKIKWV